MSAELKIYEDQSCTVESIIRFENTSGIPLAGVSLIESPFQGGGNAPPDELTLNFAYDTQNGEWDCEITRKDEGSPWLQHLAHLLQRPGGFCHVVQGADHRGCVEQVWNKRQAVDIRGNVQVLIAGAQPLACLAQLSTRIIHQDDALESLVARRVAPRAGPEFQQKPALGRQQPLQGNRFNLVLVCATSLLPETGLVVRVFVVDDGGAVDRHGQESRLCQVLAFRPGKPAVK